MHATGREFGSPQNDAADLEASTGGDRMANLNKLFPRLPIRSKLAVAFALLATIPLLATGILGTRTTLRYIEASAATALDSELETARARTESVLLSAEEDVAYLSETLFRSALEEDGATRGEPDRSGLAAFLRRKPLFLQVKLFTAEGEPLLAGRSPSLRDAAGDPWAGGAYYAFRARSLDAGQVDLAPVEVMGPADGTEVVTAIPAMAVIHPIRDGEGRLAGVAVGEIYASELFRALEGGPFSLPGATGLVDADGLFLYHSERKRDWNTLLAARPEMNLMADLGDVAAGRILAGTTGDVRASGDRLVRALSLRVKGPDGRPLLLYRAVPVSALQRPARRFLWGVGTGGVLVLAASLTLAVVAATQFTRPIYQLREGARRIAAGDFDHLVEIRTNDEIEELAVEFSGMAHQLRVHRQRLEEIVERRTAALREAHTELDQILTHSEDAILRVDVEGRVRIWNRGAEKLLGFRVAEAVGRDVATLLLPAGEGEPASAADGDGGVAPFLCPEVERVLNHHTALRRKDGTTVHVSLSKTVIRNPAERPVGHTLILRDVTQQKAMERQILRSERLAAAGELAAAIAHEINNPIGIIANRLDLLDLDIQERCPGCFARADLQVVRDQAERVGEVARRLLSLARDDPEVRTLLDLNVLAEGVIAFLQPGLEKKGLRVEWMPADRLPDVPASPRGLETVLANLLLNAADASRPGGGIRVRTRPTPGDVAVEIEVSDAGAGIPPEHLERIFEPFFTTKEHPRGTGLGLAVTRNVVQAHGGEIRVRSRPGAGSSFTVRIPVSEQRREWTRDTS